MKKEFTPCADSEQYQYKDIFHSREEKSCYPIDTVLGEALWAYLDI